MARPSEFEEFLAFLTEMPWWVSVTIGAAFFFAVRYGIPLLPIDWGLFEDVILKGSSIFSWFGFIFLLPAGVSVVRIFRDRHLLKANKTKASFRDLDWRTFEDLIEAYYRQLGYRIERQRKGGADGGVDMRVTNNHGETFLVQCKRWVTARVGPEVVRELFGVVTAENAAGGIVVTSGSFTIDAYDFAENNGIELIDGDRLDHMLGDTLAEVGPLNADKNGGRKTCPLCGSRLVVRQARRGANPGSSFYGCSTFPDCRFTQDLNR